jgi:hypothetical protein
MSNKQPRNFVREGARAEAEIQRAIPESELTAGNAPFDLTVGNNVIEVKRIVHGINDKITMHPASLARKVDFALNNGVEPHTVVKDDRTGQVFYKEGVGSFRLSSMREVPLSELGQLIQRDVMLNCHGKQVKCCMPERWTEK